MHLDTITNAAADRLRDIGLFGGLSDEMLGLFAGPLEVLEVDAGAVIYRERDSGRDMFVILEGKLETIRLSKRSREVTVGTLEAGMWFGEKSILDMMPRSATVRAATPTRLLRITAHDLDMLYRRDLKAYTLIVLNIARETSRQLRVAEGMVVEVVTRMVDEYSLHG